MPLTKEKPRPAHAPSSLSSPARRAAAAAAVGKSTHCPYEMEPHIAAMIVSTYSHTHTTHPQTNNKGIVSVCVRTRQPPQGSGHSQFRDDTCRAGSARRPQDGPPRLGGIWSEVSARLIVVGPSRVESSLPSSSRASGRLRVWRVRRGNLTYVRTPVPICHACVYVREHKVQIQRKAYPACLAPRLVQTLRSRCLAAEILDS